jgi:RimJ/RimL family protein N-acetyltransferase
MAGVDRSAPWQTRRVYPVSLTGQLVELRELRRSDVAAVQRWTGDPEVTRYIPLGPTSWSEARSYVVQIRREATSRNRRVYTLGVVDRADGELVGTVGLTVDSTRNARAELGYVLRRDRWNRGLATDAAATMVDFGFDQLGLHRIWATCDVDNDVSARVLEKVGMRYEGHLRGDLRIGHEWRDSSLYAVLRDERTIDEVYL